MTRKSPFLFNRPGFRRAALASLIVAALTGCSEPELSETEHLQRAQEFQEKGEMRAAIIELKNVLSKDPDNPDTRLQLGMIYLDAGIGDGAEKELRRARDLGASGSALIVPLAKAMLLQGKNDALLDEIDPRRYPAGPTRARLHALRALAYLNQGRPQKAAEELEFADAEDTSGNEVLLAHAQLALVRQDLDGAREFIDKALKADPDFADAWALLGNLELSLGNLAEAEAAYEKAIESRHYPGPEVARRALIRIHTHRFTEAQKDIRRLVDAGFGDHPYVSYVRGMNQFAQGHFAEALEAFQDAYAKAPSLGPLNFYLAATHYALGHKEQALAFAQRAYADAPRSLRAKRLLGTLKIGYADYDNGRQMLQKLLEERPRDTSILRLLAIAAMFEGDTSQAVNYLSQLVELLPESEQAKDLLMMAKLLDGQGLDDLAPARDEEGDYTGEFLYALAKLRDKQLAEALELGEKLAEKYPEKADPHKLVAAIYMMVGQWKEASEALEAALQREPDDASAVINLAKIRIHAGELEKARALLQKLSRKQPQEEEAILLLAGLEARLTGPQEGIRILEEALEKNPGSTLVRKELASAYLRIGDAAKVLDLTRELDSKTLMAHPPLLEYRGKAAMLLNDLPSAVRAFQQWTQAAPHSAKAYFLYSDALARSGNDTESRAALLQSLKLDPHYLPARIGRVKMLVRSGDLKGARKALSDLRTDFGNRPEVLAIEGWLALGTGDFETAANRLRAALDERPDREVALLLTRALGALQKHQEAAEVLQQWLADHPRDLAMSLQLAEVLLAMKKEEAAASLYEELLQQQPDLLVALNNLAWLRQDEAPQRAMEYAERAYNIAPKDPVVLDTYGMLLKDSGEKEKAYRMISEAARLAPENPDIQLHLGMILADQKHYTKAKAILASLVDKAPRSQAAREASRLLKEIPQ